jgi:hypothetical protein
MQEFVYFACLLEEINVSESKGGKIKDEVGYCSRETAKNISPVKKQTRCNEITRGLFQKGNDEKNNDRKAEIYVPYNLYRRPVKILGIPVWDKFQHKVGRKSQSRRKPHIIGKGAEQHTG